ncbi:expressed unknown protein [Seminavis robusta]|uniref:Uncharacterized protein n=1 Tax=Seminavis robusta TaxID=568900 RepID=A0A9N8EIZ1_9STRA|nr:expressed unknown protein [Seminavis robusta]|eukprot:Sro1073_g238170.1 n/a (316) ;mRNA; f:5411-6358
MRYDGGPTSMEDYLYRLTAETKFHPKPATELEPPKLVKVNLESIRVRFQKWLSRAFFNWDKLLRLTSCPSDLYNPDDGFIDPVQQGCKALSLLMVQQLYTLLARKAAIRLGFRHPASRQYNRSHTYLEEIPAGCAYLIEQFGITQRLQVSGNYEVLHVWDGQHKDSFGVALPEDIQHGAIKGCSVFLHRLRAAGVEMRRVNLDCPERTPWDSMVITRSSEGNGLDLATTYSIQEYELPRDVFLSFVFCGPHESAGSAIERYSTRRPTEISQRKLPTNEPVAKICTVGRGVNEFDAVGFYQVLFRYGPAKLGDRYV